MLFSNLISRIERLRKSHHSEEATLHFHDGSIRVLRFREQAALNILNDLVCLRSFQFGKSEGRELRPGEVPFAREDGGPCPKTRFAKEMRMLAAAASVESEDPLIEAAHGLARELFEAERKVGMLG